MPTIDAMHMMLPKNTAHGRYGCGIDNNTENPTNGISSDANLYFSSALME